MQSDLFRPDQLERRSLQVEIRARGRTLYGYSAVFDAPTMIAGVEEVVRSTAFDRTLASGQDVVLLKDHSWDCVLARTRSGTLKLSKDSRGLHFEAEAPNTQAANDLIELCARNDIGGASFRFADRREQWKGKTRELVDVDLYEVSIVSSFPAYAATEVFVRNARGGHSRLMLARQWLATAER
jgi:HK97 family phage prohead protease